jgi:hypothetical protein
MDWWDCSVIDFSCTNALKYGKTWYYISSEYSLIVTRRNARCIKVNILIITAVVWLAVFGWEFGTIQCMSQEF